LGLADKDPQLPATIAESGAFGRPDHALFANTPGFSKEKAARIFLKRWRDDSKYPLNADIAQLFESLPPEEVLPTLRKRWGATGQESELVRLLASHPEPGDRKRFVEAMNTQQTRVMQACLDGLERLDADGKKADPDELFALIRALQRATANKTPIVKQIASRLQKATAKDFGNDSKRWIEWLAQEHPELGKRLANPDGVDMAKWNKRLANLDWSTGNVDAGKTVFAKATCAQCHGSSQSLGPDLAGVTERFSRADLFAAILQPSKDVAPRYQTTIVETRQGKVHQGIAIYDAADILILQTGAATTLRIDATDIAGRHGSSQSLMPSGLLDLLSDRQIADLYAYLRSLSK
jgi:putative heme-binding domain-containing protein